MSSRTILLIDYDPGSIESAVRPLTEAGFRVEVANDGVSGLEAFERLQPDLVMIEPMVPKKHGFEVCQEIKESPRGHAVPVLITTGFYRGRKHRLEATQYYGCDEYLEKPVSAADLVSVCSRLLPDQMQRPDQPEREVKADSAKPLVAGNVGELPDLTELSEEEIVARLDALITEEPQPAGQAGAESTPADESPASVDESTADLPEGLSEELIAELALDQVSVVERGSAPATSEPQEAMVEGQGATTEPPPCEGGIRVEEAAVEQQLDERDDAEFVGATLKPERKEGVGVVDEEPEIQVVVDEDGVEEPTQRSAISTSGTRSSADAAQPQTSRVLAEAESSAKTEVKQEQAGVVSTRAERVEPAQQGGSRKWVWISAATAAVVLIGVAVVLALVLGPGEPTTTQSVAQVPHEATSVPAPRPSKALDPQAYLMGPPEPDRAEPPAVEREAARPSTKTVEERTAKAGSAKQAQPPVRRTKVEQTPPSTAEPPAQKRVAAATAPKVTEHKAADKTVEKSSSRPAGEGRAASPVVEEGVAAAPQRADTASRAERNDETAGEEPAESLDARSSEDPLAEPPVPPVSAPGPESAAAKPSTADAATAPEEAKAEPELVRPTTRRGALVDISEVDTAPNSRKKAAPRYPLAARNLRLEGTVMLRVLVDESGKVAVVEPLPGRSAEVLVNAAVRAARDWTYEPAIKDGVPVKVWLTERVSFKL